MTLHHRNRRMLVVPLLAVSAAATAQQAPTPATPQACLAIETDATRLACYDAALGRSADDTEAADAAARQAMEMEKQVREAAAPTEDAELRERASHRLGALFGSDPSYAEARANAGKGSLLDSRWELAKDSKLGVFQLRAYKPVYLLPAFWTSDTNETPRSPNPNNTVDSPEDLNSVEAKFQISFKTKIAENLFGDNGDLWGGYTQSSRWQVYNGDISRPFRETDYEPEILLAFRNNYRIGGWHGRMSGIGLTHQSNGRSDPLSRS